MNVIGFDIGGANLKAADRDGNTVCRSFEIWKSPEQLPKALAAVVKQFSQVDRIAVTMTAELADCFQTKRQGVETVLDAVETAAEGVPVVVWQTGSEFVSAEIAREIPLLVAAANWHALATFVGRMVPNQFAVLIDIGTTTTDIVPLLNSVPVSRGMTDVERLQESELVYTGVRRTPLCAVARSVPFGENECPIAAEWFATMLDVYLVRGNIADDPQDFATANGRAATRAEAHHRLARSLCCDDTEFNWDDAVIVAEYLSETQRNQLTAALGKVMSRHNEPCQTVLYSGAGSFLAAEVLDSIERLSSTERICLSDLMGPKVSEAACAFAIARLASERLD